MYFQFGKQANKSGAANEKESVYLVDVGLLDLCFLGAGAGRVQEVAVPFYHTWGFQQAGYIEYCPQQAFLVLQTISWVFGLDVFNEYL